MLWAEAEGTRADYVEPEDVRYSAGERVAVLGAGVVAEGVVTDADGAPLAGVLVRSQQAQRGPAALTGTDGRYRLVGAKRSESLEFTHPLGESFLYFGDDPDWAPGFPLRIRLTPWEILRPDARARRSVRVRVTGPDGSPLPDVVLRCIQIDHGEVREGVTDDDPPDPGSDDDEDTGESVVSLPLGPYLIEPRSAFDDFGWNPVPFLLGADAEPPVPGVAIRATPRPRLEVVGDVPADATARLVVQGDEEPLSWDDGVLDPVHLPAEGEAVVRVELDDGVWWFPVGPAKDGVRTATVAIPPPRLLRVPGLDAWADVGLFDGPVQRTLREAEEGLATYATGDLVLRLVAEKSGLADGPGLDVPVRIDPEGSGPIDVPVPSGDARRALDVVLRVEAPDGTAFPAEFEAVDADGLDVADGETTPSSPARFPFRAGTSVRVQRDGWATLRATLDGPGERTLRWGDAAVSITALDEDGVPARFTVLLDGETFGPPGEGKETDGSAVTVRGLPAGAVEFVLLPEDEDFRGKEMRLVLRPGETRSREVVFVRR